MTSLRGAARTSAKLKKASRTQMMFLSTVMLSFERRLNDVNSECWGVTKSVVTKSKSWCFE